MTTPNPKIVERSKDQLEALLQRAEAALPEDDYETIKGLAEAYAYLTELVEAKGTTIERLRNLLFGSRTEKTRNVVPPTDRTAIQRQIDAADRQIDELVYELYGLSDDEIRIVEEAMDA